MAKCPKCGNTEFFAHQVLHVDIVVDEGGYFVRNCSDDETTDFAVYHAGAPFGPFTCTKCNAEFEELPTA